eukprot:XP_015576957.1 auxin-responsive protein SAUR68 [Ricinus communis]
MISTKKLLKWARKWQKLASSRQKSITFPSTIGSTDTSSCSTSSIAEKGHFVVYSADKQRFLLPLEYLNNENIRGLLDIVEDEFGLPSNGPLTLPCEAQLMEYALSLIKQQVARDVERALLTSIVNSCYTLPFHLHLQHQVTRHQLPISSF